MRKFNPRFDRFAQRQRQHYVGMTKPSITSRTLTPASLYTHYLDMIVGSPTYGQRVEIVRN